MHIRWILALALGVLLLGCDEEPKNLEAQKKQLQQYRQKQQALRKKIQSLEKAIAKKDTVSPERDYQLVSLKPVQKQVFRHYVQLQGQATTDENVAVSPKRSGTIEKIHCDEGDQVNKGQLLVKLDSETIQRNIEQVKTNLAHARNLYKRQKNLWEKEIGSEVSYLQAKNRVENLEKELKAAESRLANTTVTAPIRGKVDAIFMNEGEMANPASPLMRIINLRKMEVQANPSERYLDDIQEGDSVILAFPNLDITRKQPVTHVSDYIDPDTRTFEIKIRLDNPEGLIKPNVLAQVRFTDYRNEAALTIPTKLLQSSNTGYYVYTAKQENGKKVVERNYIETGRSYNGITEVKSGLERGQQLITDGFREVNDQERVITDK